MKTKEKKYIAPNECSFLRWLGVLLVSILINVVLAIPLSLLVLNRTGTFLGVDYQLISNLLSFVALFWGLVIAIKVVGKTSLKDFVLGAGGKINKKECLTVLALSMCAYIINILTELGHLHLRDISFATYAAGFLISLALIWMQTTWEELIFRGIFLRWISKNDIGFNKKSVLAAVISSALFALAHATNVEVTSLSGLERVVMVCVYTIPGMAFYLMDLYFGNLMPGIIMHFVNNFLLSIMVSGEVASLSMPTLLVTTVDHNAYVMLLGVLMSKLPFVAYILWDIWKKKKAAKNNSSDNSANNE
jgi:membrane protease YdiL (CAAX protease family)